ncbi:DJ-1/PfpI family protein [Psychrobacillus sp. NPDC096389]|uniref:DJ-1/PfpI family protein n=1 Tax=Psychrobacillus sp. NPDC096389 TaxID=3364490 RepID=UPI00382B2FD2
MKKILFFAYPQYADFEIAHALFLLRKIGKYTVTTVSVDGEDVESVGGLWTKAEGALSDINVSDFSLILIPGGDGVPDIINEESITAKLVEAFNLSIPIASICGSAVLLGKAGILEGREFTCNQSTFDYNENIFSRSLYTGKDIEVSDQIITAKGTAFAEFAVSVGQMLDLFQDEKQYDSLLKFCKGM